jgi:hypothetical protein
VVRLTNDIRWWSQGNSGNDPYEARHRGLYSRIPSCDLAHFKPRTIAS